MRCNSGAAATGSKNGMIPGGKKRLALNFPIGVRRESPRNSGSSDLPRAGPYRSAACTSDVPRATSTAGLLSISPERPQTTRRPACGDDNVLWHSDWLSSLPASPQPLQSPGPNLAAVDYRLFIFFFLFCDAGCLWSFSRLTRERGLDKCSPPSADLEATTPLYSITNSACTRPAVAPCTHHQPLLPRDLLQIDTSRGIEGTRNRRNDLHGCRVRGHHPLHGQADSLSHRFAQLPRGELSPVRRNEPRWLTDLAARH